VRYGGRTAIRKEGLCGDAIGAWGSAAAESMG
jgi:hypothetical protein